ncbi:hypothetical protein DTO169C6_2183 [Paecilomyces variotii]|nr:hypothetical protein DTO169C6_2183 [Paecilomyces variotii]
MGGAVGHHIALIWRESLIRRCLSSLIPFENSKIIGDTTPPALSSHFELSFTKTEQEQYDKWHKDIARRLVYKLPDGRLVWHMGKYRELTLIGTWLWFRFVHGDVMAGNARKLVAQIRKKRLAKMWISKASKVEHTLRKANDYDYIQQTSPELEGEETECTHIIPFAMGHFETDAKARELQGIWVAMRRYFPLLIDPSHHFSQENINECRNTMTLNHVLHRNFGKFRIALHPTETEIEYNVLQFRATSFAKLFISANNEVIFTQHEPRYTMPSPELLRIHAIIAKVLHASGQAEYIDEILQDRDNTGVLATDGSSNVGAFLSMSQLSLIAVPARPMSENVRPGGE